MYKYVCYLKDFEMIETSDQKYQPPLTQDSIYSVCLNLNIRNSDMTILSYLILGQDRIDKSGQKKTDMSSGSLWYFFTVCHRKLSFYMQMIYSYVSYVPAGFDHGSYLRLPGDPKRAIAICWEIMDLPISFIEYL